MDSNTAKSKIPYADERGFALLWALVVIFVILVGGAIVLKVTFDYHLRVKNRALERRAEWLAKTGVTRFLVELNDPNTEPETLLDRTITDSISENESITRTLYPWGGTLLAVSTGKVGSVEFDLSRIIGQKSDLPDSVSIRTRSKQYPLVLAGTSNPAGKVISHGGKPSAGVYEGRGPTQSTVDKWTIPPFVPAELDPWLLKYELESLRNFADHARISQFGSMQFIGSKLKEITVDSLYVVDGDLDLVDCDLQARNLPIIFIVRGRLTFRGSSSVQGRIKFWARDEIVVGDSSVIDGAALVSDSVLIIKGNSISRANSLAGYRLEIIESATLERGSMASTFFDMNSGRTNPIRGLDLSSAGRVRATLALLVSDPDTRADIPRLRISSGVRFEGDAVSNYLTELENKFRGQVDTKILWHKTLTTTYLNWAIDQRIESKLVKTSYPIVGRMFSYAGYRQ